MFLYSDLSLKVVSDVIAKSLCALRSCLGPAAWNCKSTLVNSASSISLRITTIPNSLPPPHKTYRERERDTHTHTHTHTDRDRQRQRQTDRQTDRQNAVISYHEETKINMKLREPPSSLWGLTSAG